MPPPLAEQGQVEYEDGTVATISQMAKDVTYFLSWAQDPGHDERKLWGIKCASAMAFAWIFTGYWQRVLFQSLKTQRIDFTKVRM